MTSSLRNSLHRRNHKERSQLSNRARLGILEKHKDYVKRAQDYHSKQDRLTRLKQKASERNKDEFYFSMKREKTKGGVHVKDRGNVALPTDMVKILKTQDENYVRTMRASGQKKIDKLKNQLMTMADLMKPLGDEDAEGLDESEIQILQDAGIISTGKSKKKARHIVFVDDNALAQKYAGSLRSQETEENVPQEPSAGTDLVDLGWAVPEKKHKSRKRKQHVPQAEEEDEDMVGEEDTSAHHRRRLLKELSARLVRDQKLRYAEREFELQRAMMGKGARKKILAAEKIDGDDSDDEDAMDARGGRIKKSSNRVDEETYKPRVYKWRVERKR
ncbi:small-subunit processome [Dendrothele bispora CBS 962.96]|uniref:Small-subunit processome n=1 Tax=Dendrothele bispora (strain CBS 962.96) TaxID=1314807 RepID=A0A4S8MX04_DENBC|nr:small-subunit processome [Dendrothele bispora CBS 962.96]